MARAKSAKTSGKSTANRLVGGRRAIAGTQALTKGLNLLDLITSAPHAMTFADLMRLSGLPKSTLHRILQTLVDFRFVRLDEATQTYFLGYRLFEMAHQVWSEFDLRGAAEPELARLRDLSRETVRLGVLDGENVLVIDQREFAQPIRFSNGVGSRLVASASAMGKALLAYLAPEKQLDYMRGREFTAVTPNSIRNPVEMQRELDLVKARGYAISIEEHMLGASAVAAPVLNHRGEPIGAVGIVSPSFRMSPERLHAYGREVIEAARRISGNVGETFMSISSAVSPGHAADKDVSCAVAHNAFLGEGPLWLARERALLWVDILAPAVHVSEIANGRTRSIALGELVGAVVPRRRGGYVAATQSGFRSLDLSTGEMATLVTPAGMIGHRFNDAKCDASGRLWAGTLALDASPAEGALYRLDTDGSLHQIEKGFHISNGMGWSPDSRRFYLADSGRRTIYVYDFDLAKGLLSNKQVFAQFSAADGMPDGLAVDAEGHLWVAMWDGWAVKRLKPTGNVERTILLPVPRPTSCAFGGADLRTLYITSARIRLSATQLAAAPLSGSILSVELNVAGCPVGEYGG